MYIYIVSDFPFLMDAVHQCVRVRGTFSAPF